MRYQRVAHALTLMQISHKTSQLARLSVAINNLPPASAKARALGKKNRDILGIRRLPGLNSKKISPSASKLVSLREDSEQGLPLKLQQIKRIRAVRKQGLLGSLGLVGLGICLSGQELSQFLCNNISTGGVLCIVSATLYLAAKAALKIKLEVHKGSIYLQWDLPPTDGPRLAEGAIEIRPSEGKGNGAFATQPIIKSTFLGEYDGELLDEEAYWSRYPDGEADYCIGIDRDWTIDARQRAEDTSCFSPCHMNHSARRHNVFRSCNRAERKVFFYTSRTVQEGEELLLDYGRNYWLGREQQEQD